MESRLPGQPSAEAGLRVRMLGALMISRGGIPLQLPASRKARALFGYLAMAPHPPTRSHLCEMLWDVPNDPRGELRWCLSKLRRALDQPGRRRVDARGDVIGLDLSDCSVDALEIVRAAKEGQDAMATERLRALVESFDGDFLQGLELDRAPAFNAWLTAQRRRFRACHAALLECLTRNVSVEESSQYLEKWLELAPFDQRPHEILLNTLACQDRLREGEEHLAATARLFETEGIDSGPLRQAWQASRAHKNSLERVQDDPRALLVGSERHPEPAVASRRASIAVMPFVDRTGKPRIPGGTADGLAHDVITRLAKLRTLVVIAQGTVFALHDRHLGAEEVGRILNVDYTVSGSLYLQGKRLNIAVELAEARSSRIVWAEVFDQKLDDAFLVLDEIGDRIVASIASEIEAVERNRAILRPPNSLDAWEAHHRGLWHMYRFSKADNEHARRFFERSVCLDPTFSRAYAGLSFTHFQSAFQGWENRDLAVDHAFDAAGQSLMADDRDPAAHWAMGRALWLRRQHDQSVVELEHAVDLSPNFALGHYTLAFVHSQAGDPEAAISSSDHSRHLSPFDPLLFGIFGARAMALVRLGQFQDAAEWAIKAATRPNAHAHILAIAAFALALAGRTDEARSYLASIHNTLPQYNVDDFLAAMQFTSEGEHLFRKGARLISG
jgi:DNA-binding SARP family transcriptional activator